MKRSLSFAGRAQRRHSWMTEEQDFVLRHGDELLASSRTRMTGREATKRNRALQEKFLSGEHARLSRWEEA